MFVKRIKLKKYKDSRGFLLELLPTNYKKKFYYSILTSSKKNVIRGLHYEKDLSEEKIIYIVKGKILDVCVNLKKGKDYKKIYYNSLKKGDSIYISKGLAHGYRCIGKENVLLYFLSKTYNPKKNRGIKWDDKILNIFWRIKKPILSIKDRNLPTLLTNKK
jgi:dTDP-4-dehydrorhamnose 3,5-epimerase